jgi:hypothetical protein
VNKNAAESPAATAALLRTKAELLLGHGKWEQALTALERCVPLNRRIFGTYSYQAVQDDSFVGRAYETMGDMDEALRRYTPLPGRFASFFFDDNPRWQCGEIARFFVNRRRCDLAESAYLLLAEWYKSNPPEWSWEFDLFLETVTRAEGWPAAAAIVRTNIDHQPGSPTPGRRRP